MMKWSLLLFLFLGFQNALAGLPFIHIVTEEYPPYNYIDSSNQLTGLSTEVVMEVLKTLGVKHELKVYPWARAYMIATKEKNTLIFSISHIRERDKMFKWVGKIAPQKVFLFKLKSRTDVKAETLEDVKKYRVGMLLNDSGYQYLLHKGFEIEKNLQGAPIGGLNLKKLLADRIDMMGSDEATMYYRLRKQNLEPQVVDKVLELKEISSDLEMAFGLSTSDKVVSAFQNALEQFKKTPRYREILKKYNVRQ